MVSNITDINNLQAIKWFQETNKKPLVSSLPNITDFIYKDSFVFTQLFHFKLVYLKPKQLFGLVGRVFANGPGDLGSILGCVIHKKTLKMVLDTPLLNTQQYKGCIEGKGEQSRERSSGVVAIEKGAFWSPLTTVANNNNNIVSSIK